MAYIHKVNYYECDGMGITHHSNYIRFMEEARIDWMDRNGYGFDKMEKDGIVSPVVDLECRYRHTTTFTDEISIEVRTLEVTPLKLRLSYEMKVGDTVVFTATSTHCFLENGKPVVLEKRYPELYKNIINCK